MASTARGLTSYQVHMRKSSQAINDFCDCILCAHNSWMWIVSIIVIILECLYSCSLLYTYGRADLKRSFPWSLAQACPLYASARVSERKIPLRNPLFRQRPSCAFKRLSSWLTLPTRLQLARGSRPESRWFWLFDINEQPRQNNHVHGIVRSSCGCYRISTISLPWCLWRHAHKHVPLLRTGT